MRPAVVALTSQERRFLRKVFGGHARLAGSFGRQVPDALLPLFGQFTEINPLLQTCGPPKGLAPLLQEQEQAAQSLYCQIEVALLGSLVGVVLELL